MRTNPQIPTESEDKKSFRRGLSWLLKTGIGHTGKKAKRLIHRRDRHQARRTLNNLSLS
jgi:hypothetical protein